MATTNQGRKTPNCLLYSSTLSKVGAGNITPLTKSDSINSGSGRSPAKRVLTVPGMSQVTRWKLNEVFGKVPLSYHYDPDRVKDGYFQSVAKGQEFVFDEDPRVTDWVRSLFD